MEGTALGFNNCFGAFLVMIVGVGTGVLLLIAESFVKQNIEPVLKNSSDVLENNQSNVQAAPETRPRPLPQPIEVSTIELQ